MKTDYLKSVQWSEGDGLFIGGVCHGSDKETVCRELSWLVAAEIAESQQAHRALPKKSALVTMPVTV